MTGTTPDLDNDSEGKPMKRILSILAATALCGAIAAPQPAIAAAYYFESRTTIEGEGVGNNGQIMNVRAWIDGANAKIEFVDGEMGFFQEGGYMLTNDGAQIVYIVDPEKQTYSELNLDALLGMAGTMMNAVGGIMKMEFTDFTNEKIAEEPGGEILGYSTTRYEHHTGFTMNMAVMGFKRSNRTDTRQEAWCTSELDATGFQAWLSPDRFRTGNAEFDEVIKAGYQDMGNCMPLRTRTATTSTGERGAETSSVSTTEVTVLREEASLGPAMFELPAGFTAQPLIPEMPADFALPEGSTSEGAEDEGGEQPRLRLRDLLRR
jgi:hypothetical protein